MQRTSPCQHQGQGTYNLASPVPVLTAVPSLPQAAQCGRPGHGEGFLAVLPPQQGSHPFPACIYTPQCICNDPFPVPMRAAPKGRASCFLNCSKPPGQAEPGQESSPFCLILHLAMTCSCSTLSDFFFLILISYFEESALLVFWLPELSQCTAIAQRATLPT